MNASKLRLSKLILALLGFGLVLIVILGLTGQDLIRVPWFETTRRKFLLYNGTDVDLFGSKKMEQTIVVNYPGLARIDVLFNRSQVEGQQVVLHLKDTCGAEADIVHVTTRLPVIEDFVFYPFEFSPLDDSAGQSYCVVVEAPEAAPEKGVRLRLSAGDLYPYGAPKIDYPRTESEEDNAATPKNGENDSLPYKIYLPIVTRGPDANNLAGDMGFRLHYRGPLLPTAQVFVARLTANKPLVWGQSWFYGGLVIVYGILLVGLFYVAQWTVQADRGK